MYIERFYTYPPSQSRDSVNIVEQSQSTHTSLCRGSTIVPPFDKSSLLNWDHDGRLKSTLLRRGTPYVSDNWTPWQFNSFPRQQARKIVINMLQYALYSIHRHFAPLRLDSNNSSRKKSSFTLSEAHSYCVVPCNHFRHTAKVAFSGQQVFATSSLYTCLLLVVYRCLLPVECRCLLIVVYNRFLPVVYKCLLAITHKCRAMKQVWVWPCDL